MDRLGMTLTEFKLCHLDGVVALENECFSKPWSREDLKSQLNNKNARFFVAVDGEKVVGYCGSNVVCGEGYITDIAVKKEYRRKNIAKSLVEAVAKECTEFLSLEVRESNIAAISLYEKMGFSLKGKRKNFYENPVENALIYTKYLK